MTKLKTSLCVYPGVRIDILLVCPRQDTVLLLRLKRSRPIIIEVTAIQLSNVHYQVPETSVVVAFDA